MGTSYVELMDSGAEAYANSAPSLLTKDIKDLAQSEVLISSLVCVAFLIVVLLGFGIKTYLHPRKTVKSTNEETLGIEPPVSPVYTEFRAASAPELPKSAESSTGAHLGRSEPAVPRVENQARHNA